MSPKEVILEQLRATHDQKAWFVSFNDAVAGMTAENAAMKDPGGTHSVLGIVNHLIFWNGRWLTRLNGGVPPETKTENSGTFTDSEGGEDQWPAAVKKLNEISLAIIDKVNKSDDSFLSGEAFPGYGASWYAMLTQMTIHNAYHIGQIVYLRKQFGNWDSSIGVGA